MRKRFIALCLLTAGITAQATEYAGILITMTDGTTTTIRIDEKPIVTINENSLIIKTSGITTELDRTKVARFNFLDEESGIDVIDSEQPSQVKCNGDIFIFNDLAPNSEIRVYNLDGVLLLNEVATGDYILDASNLTTGIYIVNINGLSTKIAVTK